MPVCPNVIAELRRRRNNLPQRFDLLVIVDERLSRFRLEKATVDDLLQALVSCAAIAGVEVIGARLSDTYLQILDQQIQVLYHPTNIGAVELERLLQLSQDTN